MSTIDQYKEEAMRFLDMYPLEACERVAARINGRGWKLDKFDCKVEIFDAVRWYAKVHIKTDVTKKKLEEKWAELQKIFAELDLSASLVMLATESKYDTHTFRKYDRILDGRRILLGHYYDFHVEFKPAAPLDASVLTEEEV